MKGFRCELCIPRISRALGRDIGITISTSHIICEQKAESVPILGQVKFTFLFIRAVEIFTIN